MKAGLITINDLNNYGNRLQNYAVQYYLKKEYNIDVYTIKNRPSLNENNLNLKYFLEFIKENIINIIENTYTKNERQKLFKSFNKYIKFNNKIINWYGNYKKISNDYDLFLVGSDQVWNPHGRMTDIELLNFTDKNKIAFSASLGVKDMPQNFNYERAKNALLKFKAISVREDSGKKLIEKISGRNDIITLIDPTMLLSASEWDEVSKKPKQKDNKKFILNYFLGELSEQRKKEIERIAEENNCEIINLLDKNDKYYYTGPSEFLWLEKNAFLVCTDSFHSSVFAILYNTPFIVFSREDKNVSMNSRLENLLTKFKLENRFYDGKINENLLQTDYLKCNQILSDERKKVKEFINEFIK